MSIFKDDDILYQMKEKMEFMQSQSFLMKIGTSDRTILNAWNSLIDILMIEKIECEIEYREFSQEQSSTKYTIIITSHAENNILVKIGGLSEKVQRLPFLAKEALLEVLWATSPISLKASKAKNLELHCIPLSTVQDELLEELRQKEKKDVQDLSVRKIMMNGSGKPAWKLEEEILMSHHLPISELIKSLQLIPKQSEYCTPCHR